MLYLTCTTIPSVDLAHYIVSHAKDWISVDCGTNAIFAGFFQGTGNNNILQQAQVPILNNTQCSGWYGSDLQVDMDAGILCAGYQFGGIDACQVVTSFIVSVKVN